MDHILWIMFLTVCVIATSSQASTCFDGYCQNGGTCSNFQGKANCSCPSNFTGDQCQHDVDECQMNNQCRNGGTCSNTYGSYICHCIFGWDGPDCSINKDDCVPFGHSPLCFNGGTCVDRIGKFDCICPPGKMGPVCQYDDQCFHKPCYGSATCLTDAFGQYSCNCPRGWTGKNCSIDVDECNWVILSPCHHGGTCINTPGSFTCICVPGYTGQQVCVSLPTSTPTRTSPKPSVVASISLTPELPTRATTTISIDFKKFEGSGKVEEPWESEFGNNKSHKYKDLKGKLETHLRGILEKKYGQNLLYLEVKNFRKGSIIFDFTVFLTSTTHVDANSLEEAIEEGEGGSANFTVSVNSVRQVTGLTQSVPSTSPTVSKGQHNAYVLCWMMVNQVLLHQVSPWHGG